MALTTKVGGASTIQIEKTSVFPLYCLRLALPLQYDRHKRDKGQEDSRAALGWRGQFGGGI